MGESVVATVPIDKIKVGVRRRVDLGEIEKLQSSIERVGLLNPIIIDDTYELIAGFRRLTCCKKLGYKEINVTFKKDLSDLQKKELELEENTYKELTWSEVAMLRADIHAIKQELYGKPVKGHSSDGWTLNDTADSLGLSAGTLSQDLTLSEALKKFPELRNLTSKRQAVNTLGRVREAALLSELARREAKSSFMKTGIPYILHNGDSLEFLKEKVDDETVDLVIFDPPWGIDSDLFVSPRGREATFPSYKDDSLITAKTFTELILPEIYRVMKQNTHLYMFIASQYEEYWTSFLSNSRLILEPEKEPHYITLDEKREWAFNVRSYSLIWVKEGGGPVDVYSKFMPRYEKILFCNKGSRGLNSVCSDVLEFKRPLSVERIHTQQKPTDLLQLLIRLSSLPHEVVLDPCAGSFATIVSATLLGRRSIGIEKDKDAFNKGLEWVKGIKEEDIEPDDDEENE